MLLLQSGAHLEMFSPHVSDDEGEVKKNSSNLKCQGAVRTRRRNCEAELQVRLSG